MGSMFSSSVFFGVVLTILGYQIGLFLKKKFKAAIFNPILIAVIFVIFVLRILHISYENYQEGAKYISYLLTPATVCLSIPLYQQLELLKKNYKAILGGIFAGVLSCMGSVLIFSKLFGFTKEQYITMLPKSITTAIGMGVSEELGGIVTITVVVIILTGICGNMIGTAVFRVFRIKHPIAQGVALGTASHAIGTARALELGEVEGAMGGLAIAVAGIITVVTSFIFSNIYLI